MERNYEFRKRMQHVHKPNRRLVFSAADPDTVEIDDLWTIWIPTKEDLVLYNAARDLMDYFTVSMDLCLKLQIGGQLSDKSIVYVLDETLSGTQYRLEVTQSRITLAGGTSRTAAQAGYYAEDLMNFAEGPYLQLQETVKQPLYEVRMTHSGYGMDNYPDAHLNAIAHAGFTAILLFVRGYNQGVNSCLDFNDVIHRAAGYGLDVYAYGYIKSLVYPEGEEGKAYYDGTYGELFRRCPGFKGLVLVGESCQFHSRDERTSGRFHRDNIDSEGKRIDPRPDPGWWPCSDYPLLVNMIKDAIHTGNPNADLVFWTYNWSFRPIEPRLELIRNLPQDISIELTIEKNATVEHNGVVDHIRDYSLYLEGFGNGYSDEAQEVKRCGQRLYTMTNTAGATWDFGVIPYVPAPGQWMRRYDLMRKFHDSCGLCGLMESHHYGFYPSFITDLAKWMFHSPDTQPEEIQRRLAVRDFSEETADAVVQAWELVSRGIRHTVSNNTDQYGPYRIGPGYPLLFEKSYTIPSEPYAYFGGNDICYPMYRYPLETPEDYNRIRHELDFAQIAFDCYSEAADLLQAAAKQIHATKQDQAHRLAGLVRFMACSVKTAMHTKLWRLAKEGQDWASMLEIGAAELENARSAIPLVEFDSRLGYEPSMEYMADPAHIRWKIEVTQQVMDEEIRPKLQ